MKKLLFIIGVSFFSCTEKIETCRDKTFGDYTWHNDSNNSIQNLHITEDSISFNDGPPPLKTWPMTFSQDCNRLTYTTSSGLDTFDIVKNTGDIIWLKYNGGAVLYFSK